MSEATRLRDARKQIRLIDTLSEGYRRQLRREFDRTVREALTMGLSGAISAHRVRLTALSKKHDKRVVDVVAEKVLGGLKAGSDDSLEFKGVFDFLKLPTLSQMRKKLSSWVDKFVGNRVKGIVDTTKERIKNAIDAAVTKGLSESETHKLVVSHMDGIDKSRALNIARTETHQVAMETQQQTMETAAESLDATVTKTWVSSLDERTRDSHRDANGQTVPVDKPFKVGGAKLRQPGDPLGPPEEVINCRCAVTYNVK